MDFLLYGFAAFAAVQTLRKFPRVQAWVLDGIKPWACDPCLSSWCALGVVVPLGGWSHPGAALLEVVRLAPAAAGVCLFLLRIFDKLASPPAGLGRLS